jgi:hypothetical protein
MARILRFRNNSVYVFDERGAPHHLPHALVKGRGGRHVASVYLLSLELFNVVGEVSKDLVNELQVHQDVLLEAWEELNSD